MPEPEWFLRLREEQMQLRDKVEKLDAFLKAPGEPTKHHSLLARQWRAMVQYDEILRARINLGP